MFQRTPSAIGERGTSTHSANGAVGAGAGIVDFDGDAAPDAAIRETLAAGYRFQAQTIRRALVALQDDRQPAPPSTDQTFSSTTQVGRRSSSNP